MITLVTGATRSGKSEWAEHLAMQSQKSVIYIATATRYPDDAEWEARLQKHSDRRPTSWQTLEVPIELAKSILEIRNNTVYVLVDSIGTWLANLLEESEESWLKIENELLKSIQLCAVDITLVSEEVGWGIVPEYKLGRTFRDRLGSLSRKIGAIADAVYLVTGGYAVNLNQIGEKLP
ncbi:MAG: bifunctional adenosylcobinamide kinase/adenosylcobinamide-phosphate guanylyltransferase [Pseudanabaena sp.]|jgi:adenosylcobinamide kinase/adenosylcobinamide-phosphate guanylyltransferase|uniref:bifunctional adenosylcobinamide kinase/adenosylcobinamide-phosphate guanylyltransferase n=1 Tax=Pseudanabaena mucicola TaxID=71190 RepID=UPI0025751182|nr:bifunctional adenosylcobinamide kinase/adenosylcobinamide-phosphate guanylyltransferase [Pseudanabaena mucicola]MCA6572775.1 bifunctional adenosylcobinamide kinase/adenosylcobinamide-phosphate guanylyltransferase [Pseudanabaena sp. M53BS1SP1A06MG]MCA6584640.1 bifunctional adenosylcobinamide kinase/adenosylcobinamide-phosphate guanylyltransferase [Pseudanabaena sp. M34BS1SP1A06MG]MCA6586899.1 bifunctional adenosylcobinamide kinase/adenosylcobinamide-phosphate guanylyltransferase [Pseudanabaena